MTVQWFKVHSKTDEESARV